MATIQKQFFRGSAFTSESTLYTVPSSTEAIVTNIIVSNSSDVDQTFSILIDGYSIALDTQILANGLIAIDAKQVMSEGEVLSAYASSGDVNFHISGVEIS